MALVKTVIAARGKQMERLVCQDVEAVSRSGIVTEAVKRKDGMMGIAGNVKGSKLMGSSHHSFHAFYYVLS